MKYTMTVLGKELKDSFRDKKTIIMALLLPLLLYPAIFWFMGRGIAQVEGAVHNATIALSGPQMEQLDADGNIQFYDVDFTGVAEYFNVFFEMITENDDGESGEESNGAGLDAIPADGRWYVDTEIENPRRALERGNVTLVFVLSQADVDALLAGEQFDIEILYNNTRSASTHAVGFAQFLFGVINDTMAQARLYEEHGISLSDYAIFSSISASQWNEQIARGEDAGSGGNQFLAMQLPLLLLLMLAQGPMTAAIDMFAGEKERKTMESLLSTHAGRGSIMTGKFLAVNVLGFLVTVSTIAGIFIGFGLTPGLMDEGGGFGFLLELSPLSIIMTFGLIMAVQFSFAVIHIILSSYARNIKEATTYCSMLMMAAMVPAFMTMFMSSGDFTRWQMAIPLFNVAGSLKMILEGAMDYAMVWMALGFSALFLLVLLFITSRLFKNENIMLRT